MNKVLIANRGEIACRVIKTCKKLGITTVALVSDADRGSLHSKLADEVAILPGNEARETYLNIPAIIEACQKLAIDGVHPGYGFLSENPEFANAVEQSGMTFIGPTSDSMKVMGLKAEARQLANQNGVPVCPGYDGDDQKDLAKKAKDIGFPLLVKASAGGGGRGMKVVESSSDLDRALSQAANDAKIAFGNDRLILEKYIAHAKHIEVQVLGDGNGEVIALGERECSLQRRHQKIIEECPSPLLTDDVRQKMMTAACNLAKAVNYRGVGTVEFIVNADNLSEFYFLEMNTRLQVEHCVTEMVYGVDLVEAQIDVALNKGIDVYKNTVPSGHSIQARVYAEDAANGFSPRSGKIVTFIAPENIRLDGGIQSGDEVGVFYDPLLTKVISFGANRNEALNKLKKALGDMVLLGLTTNQQYLRWLLDQENVLNGKMTTTMVEKLPYKEGLSLDSKVRLLASFVTKLNHLRSHERAPLSFLKAGWRSNPSKLPSERIVIEGRELECFWRHIDGDSWEIQFENQMHFIKTTDQGHIEYNGSIKPIFLEIPNWSDDEDCEVCAHSPDFGNVSFTVLGRFPDESALAQKGDYLSPMPGKIQEVFVKEGTKVKAGEKLLVMESMKMENPIDAHTDGTVSKIFVGPGELVETNTRLIHIEEE